MAKGIETDSTIPRGRPAPLPVIATRVALGWLIPGLGHYLSGETRRGIALGVLISGAFLLGFLLSDKEAVSKQLHPYSFFAQVFVGGGTLPALYFDPARDKILEVHSSISTREAVPRFNDTGVLFCNIAGLLNLLVLLDLIDRQLEPRKKPKPAL